MLRASNKLQLLVGFGNSRETIPNKLAIMMLMECLFHTQLLGPHAFTEINIFLKKSHRNSDYVSLALCTKINKFRTPVQPSYLKWLRWHNSFWGQNDTCTRRMWQRGVPLFDCFSVQNLRVDKVDREWHKDAMMLLMDLSMRGFSETHFLPKTVDQTLNFSCWRFQGPVDKVIPTRYTPNKITLLWLL